jgi:hypothetical protein
MPFQVLQYQHHASLYLYLVLEARALPWPPCCELLSEGPWAPKQKIRPHLWTPKKEAQTHPAHFCMIVVLMVNYYSM